MKLYHVRTLDHLKRYKETWDHILEANRNNNPFIEFPWVENWWRYLGGNRGIEIIVVEDNENVIAFFPFQITSMMNITLIEFIGRGDANYMDIVVYNHEREKTIKFVLDELMDSMPKCIFNLHGLLSSSPTTNMLNLYLKKKKCEASIFSVVTPFINMESVELEPYLKKRRKIHGLDRTERRLRYLGAIKVTTCDSTEIERVFSLHNKHWKQNIDTSQFTEEAHKQFYSSMLKITDNPLQAKVECLYLDDQMIAFSYGFLCRGRYHRYVTGHDDDYGLYSPGTILDKELISNSQNKSIRIFDLSIGYEPYKFEWNTGVDYSNTFLFSSTDWKTKMMYQFFKGKGYLNVALKKNHKMVLSTLGFIGKKLYFIENAKFRDWVKASKKLAGKIYSQKSIDVYQQSQGLAKVMDYKLTKYPEAKKHDHDLQRVNKRYFNGFIPYSDESVSTFWIHSKVIRADEVGYLEPLPKESVFITGWQIHKLSNICSFLRGEQDVKEIFLYTSKQDNVVTKHLQQLGFIHRNRIKKTSVFSKTKIHVSSPTVKE
ncbi:MAG: GNAT family N-acetyltransferase [Paenisporosarcina sp.]